MTTKERIRCNVIIHGAGLATAGVGAGLAQIPTSDNAVITPIQLAMTISLGRVFDIQLTESAATATIASVAATTIGRAASQVFIGWIPGLGNAINAGTAATLTETIGWLLVKEFEAQRDERKKS